MSKLAVLIFFLSAVSLNLNAQDTTDLMQQLQVQPGKDYTIATFKATRLINGHTVENLGKGVLDVRISHRFGRVNGGIQELFGLDNATARIGIDYGFSNRLMAGLGRSSFEKTADAFLKWKILRQASGNSASPFTVNYAASIAWTTLKNELSADPGFRDQYRLSFAHQLIIGRKFSAGTSLMLIPTYVHRNLVPRIYDPNDIFALGVGGRQKLSRRISFTAEFYPQMKKIEGTGNSLSLGLDIETGGHVFQLHFSNSQGINEKSFITGTTGEWGNGDVHFGFNISRVFTVGKRGKAS